MKGDAQKFNNFWDSRLGFQVLQREARFVYRHLKDSESILDVGCGNGVFERALPDLELIGLDNDPAMLEEAKKRSDKPFHYGNATQLGFPQNSLDAVLFVTTLEYLPDYQPAIREAWRVTKNNGKVLAMMLNPDSQYFKEHLKNKNSSFHRIKHRPQEIKEYLAGFYTIFNEARMLSIRGGTVSDTRDRKEAAVYAVVGKKRTHDKYYCI